jgi:ParB-like chromosome segregation protein Spo0J
MMDAITKSWRELLKVHPAAEIFPMMSPEEMKVLAADIAKNGLQMPIVVYPGDKPMLLDGRNRLDAMEAIGYRFADGDFGRALKIFSPNGVARDMDWQYIFGGDPYEFVISANIHRRHLTKEEQANRLVAVARAKVEHQASRSDISRHGGEKTKSGGRPKDLVKETAVELGEQHGISKRTIERATAKAAGKTPQPRKPKGQVPLDDPARPRNRDVAKPVAEAISAPAANVARPKYQVLYLVDTVTKLPPDQRGIFFNLCSQQEKLADQMRAALGVRRQKPEPAAEPSGEEAA